MNGWEHWLKASREVEDLNAKFTGAFQIGERIALINARAQLVQAWNGLTDIEKEWIIATQDTQR